MFADAHLEHWYIVRDKDGSRQLIGVISNDVTKRFRDGQPVRSGNLRWISREFRQARTTNALYTLGQERKQ